MTTRKIVLKKVKVDYTMYDTLTMKKDEAFIKTLLEQKFKDANVQRYKGKDVTKSLLRQNGFRVPFLIPKKDGLGIMIPDDLTVEKVADFKEYCILGRYVGLEVLGKLLYSIYDKNNHYFDNDKVHQLSQIDWSRKGQLWTGNIVTIDPNPKNPAKPYKISMSMSSVKIAVDKVKIELGWIQPPPTQFQLYS